MKSLLYIEVKDKKPLGNSLELITMAKQLGEVLAVVLDGENQEAAQTVSRCGVDVLLMEAKVSCQDEAVALLEQAVQEEEVQALFFAATQEGKDLAPRLAARLHTGCITDIFAVKKEGEDVLFQRPAYGGAVLENLQFAKESRIVGTVRSGSFAKPEMGEEKVITRKTVQIPEDAVKAKLLEKTVEITELVNLEGAEVIVSGGRGCKTKETFALVEELAKVLGGVVGASRPAIEAGWVSRAHQVGQSGKNVAPKLYIACGISGAMQHISGITGADYIVAVNTDEDAPIFDVADVGMVGKCEDILPLLIDAVRARNA